MPPTNLAVGPSFSWEPQVNAWHDTSTIFPDSQEFVFSRFVTKESLEFVFDNRRSRFSLLPRSENWVDSDERNPRDLQYKSLNSSVHRSEHTNLCSPADCLEEKKTR